MFHFNQSCLGRQYCCPECQCEVAGVVVEVFLDLVRYAVMQSSCDRPLQFGGDEGLSHGTEVCVNLCVDVCFNRCVDLRGGCSKDVREDGVAEGIKAAVEGVVNCIDPGRQIGRHAVNPAEQYGPRIVTDNNCFDGGPSRCN